MLNYLYPIVQISLPILIIWQLSKIKEPNYDELKSHHKALLEEKINQLNNHQQLQQTALKADILNTVLQTLKHHHDQSTTNYQHLTNTVQKRLQEISKEVNEKLNAGLEKNNAIFHSVIKRLSLIDQAQQKITNLTSHVTDLKGILTDKSSRGSFGEVQLEQLIDNMIPQKYCKKQETLPNGKRVDCLLLMPSHGHIAIDAKFPLENYQKQFTQFDKKIAFGQFKIDIKKHIDDISERYIIPGFTMDGAIMFIPAEAIFAHIHAKHPDLIAYAQKQNVWLTSPTTLMAVLNTALGVIKDHATKAQINVIKEHLSHLAEDFQRFEKRMDQLAKHINQVNNDVGLIQVSSQKITKRFIKIENCSTIENQTVEQQ